MNRVMLFLFPILIAGTAYVGWAGVVTKQPIVAESCRESYPHHLIKPFIRTWWECRRQTPCGVDERFDEHNATVRVIQCLCRGSDDNAEKIITLYQSLPLSKVITTDTTVICTTVTEQGRL